MCVRAALALVSKHYRVELGWLPISQQLTIRLIHDDYWASFDVNGNPISFMVDLDAVRSNDEIDRCALELLASCLEVV